MSNQLPVISVGADHAGFELKERLKRALEQLGFEPLDVGTHSRESTDYPDYAHQVAEAVATGRATRGILTCGTGVGMAMAANRHRGVRAAVAWSPEIAELSRRHNDANVIALPARFLAEEDAVEILKRWLEASFDGGRHARRVNKIDEETT